MCTTSHIAALVRWSAAAKSRHTPAGAQAASRSRTTSCTRRRTRNCVSSSCSIAPKPLAHPAKPSSRRRTLAAPAAMRCISCVDSATPASRRYGNPRESSIATSTVGSVEILLMACASLFRLGRPRQLRRTSARSAGGAARTPAIARQSAVHHVRIGGIANVRRHRPLRST